MEAEAIRLPHAHEMAVNMRAVGLRIWWAALGVLFFGAVSTIAQQTEPAQSTLGQRIEAAAKAALNSPRLKGLTEQQRIDGVRGGKHARPALP
jgi:hypothetical protein